METAESFFKAIDIGRLYALFGRGGVPCRAGVPRRHRRLVSGVYTARQLGQRIHSHKLRSTVDKLVPYLLVMLMAFIFDVALSVFGFYGFPYVMLAVTLAIIAIELVSVIEHARRRKSRAAKIPEVLSDIADYIGHDELRRILSSLAGKALEKHTGSQEDFEE